MSFAIKKDGSAWRAVGGIGDVLEDEDFSTDQPGAVVSQADIVKQYEDALDHHLDCVAKACRYDNRITFSLRAGYPGPYQEEGVAFAQWMDACYLLSNQIKNSVLAGERAMPTIDEFISDMPEFVLP